MTEFIRTEYGGGPGGMSNFYAYECPSCHATKRRGHKEKCHANILRQTLLGLGRCPECAASVQFSEVGDDAAGHEGAECCGVEYMRHDHDAIEAVSR